MLINTLFLSKPLTETDYSATTGSSEKLFGFLFSEIMNVNNEAEKLSLIPDHIGGNLIDYKSVFINYNFESNVLLSNPQSKDTKDPIVSLSKLFIENEIIDNQKINEPEKVIYSPQQFVDSFTQLIKLLLDNNSDASKVELKLFSRNFILSQNIDHSNLQNVQEYLVKTIENEPLFSLSLSAFNRQIVFEVFSQVVPSIINKEVTLTQNVNVDNVDENLVKINSLNSIQSKINNNTKNSSEIVNTEIQEKTADNYETRTLSVENDDVIVDKTEVKLSYLSSQNYETKGQLSAEKTIPNLSPNILKKSADNIIENTFVKSHSVAKEMNQETEKNNQINLDNRTSLENIPEKSDKNISVQSSKEENTFYQTELKNNNEIKVNEKIKQTKSINTSLKDVTPNVNNSGNTQIKIIIQNKNQNYDQLNSKESNVGLSKISTIIENTLEQSPIEINAKISLASHTEQNSNTKTVIEQFSANNIISDRQTQNLFRSLSLNKFHLQRNLTEVITNKLEKDLEQKPSITLSGESTETNLSFSSNETQNTKVEKNDLNLSPLKEQKINSEIKVNKGVNTDFSAQSNLETSEKTKNESSAKEIISQKNSNNVNENDKQNNSVNLKTDNNELTIKSDKSTIKVSGLTSNIKATKVNTVDSTVRIKTEKSGEIKIENSAKEIISQKSSNNVNENDKQNNSVNLKTDNNELTIKSDKSTIKDSGLTSDIKATKVNPVDSTVQVKTEKSEEIKIERPAKEIVTKESSNNAFANVRKNDSANYNQSVNKQENIKTLNNDNETQNTIYPDNEKQTLNIKTSEAQNIISQETKTSSKIFNGDEQSLIKNGKLNPALEVIKNSKTESNETETPDILSSQKERITSANRDVNYSKNHRDSSLFNNSFRVVNDKPAKGVSDINNNSIQEEKSISGNFNIVNEPSKEIKTTSEKENILFSETSQIDKKANLYSQQEQDNSKNSNQQYNQTLSKENPSLNTQAEHSNDFRDVVNGFEKKVTPLSSRTTNNINLNSNKFDFNKFFESKSLENFVRTLNDNNLNYRAELNNLAKSNNSIELRLYPEELGRVKIIIDNADNIVSARIEVQSEQAKNIILSNLPQLRESLKQEGLNTQNLNVYLGSDEQKGQNGANQKRKNNNKMSYDNQAQPEEVKIKNLGYNTIEYLA